MLPLVVGNLANDLMTAICLLLAATRYSLSECYLISITSTGVIWWLSGHLLGRYCHSLSHTVMKLCLVGWRQSVQVGHAIEWSQLLWVKEQAGVDCHLSTDQAGSSVYSVVTLHQSGSGLSTVSVHMR